MRYISKHKRLQFGERRTISKFLWFPRTIDGETRWLEKAVIRQEVISYESGIKYKKKWQDRAFINK